MYASFNPRALGLAVTAAEALDLAAAAGFPAVDLLVRDLVERGEDAADLRRRMDDLGLHGGAWPLPVRWKGDPATYEADLRALPAQAATAAALGLTATGTWVLPDSPDLDPPPRHGPPTGRDALFAWHLERLTPIARALDDHGTRLGLEVIGVESFRTRGGPPFVCRLADVRPLLEALRAAVPSVGIVADVFHLHAADEPLETALRWGAEGVVWAHVADLPPGAPADRAAIRDDDRGLPGDSGRVPVARFLEMLARAGYRGPVTVEPLAGCRSLAGLDAGVVARRAADALRSVWPGASDQASAVIV